MKRRNVFKALAALVVAPKVLMAAKKDIDYSKGEWNDVPLWSDDTDPEMKPYVIEDIGTDYILYVNGKPVGAVVDAEMKLSNGLKESDGWVKFDAKFKK